MNLEILSIIVFFGIIVLLIIKDRKNIEFKSFLIIRKTERGKGTIEKFAKSNFRILKISSNIAVVVAIALSIIGVVFLLSFSGVRLMLPKVFPGEVSPAVQKVAFFIPLWYWVIAIIIIVFPHEIAHGLISVVEKIRITSMGVILFLIFPGAFVEPDEVKFEKSKPETRMRIAAVGSVANFIVFIFLIILSLALTRGFYTESGVLAFQINNSSYPAKQVNLTGVITEINNKQVRNVQDLEEILNQTKPGDKIQIKGDENYYNLTLIENPLKPDKGFIGISFVKPNAISKITGIDPNVVYDVKSYPNYMKSIIDWFKNLIDWVTFLDINVAIANLLPAIPFDGGIMWQGLFEKITGKKKLSKRMVILLSIIVYGILILNLIGIKKIVGLL